MPLADGRSFPGRLTSDAPVAVLDSGTHLFFFWRFSVLSAQRGCDSTTTDDRSCGIFVDKIFALNGKQIMAGTLGAAAIAGVVRQTAPAAAEGGAIDAQTQTAIDLINRESPMTEDQRSLVNRWWGALLENRKMGLVACWSIGLVATVFAGAALLVFVKRKVRRRNVS